MAASYFGQHPDAWQRVSDPTRAGWERSSASTTLADFRKPPLEPVWSPDGRRLFYAHNQAVVAVNVKESPAFSVANRTQLFEGEFLFTYVHANYDVSPNGKEFVLVKGAGDAQAFVIHDWRAQLRARASSRK